uniref:DNA-directed RNA polymerases I, II, and III subunit RPABC1 n=1 Tax=Aegilops tauschii subsp. strangulata TaxID=200361 RepID=A0A453KAP6_AEGTS
RDRGYSVPESELARTLPEFRAWWAPEPEIERLTFSTFLASDHSDKVKILFCGPEPVRIATIQKIYDQIEGENFSRLILILQGKIMPRAKESVKEKFTFKVDIFQVNELLVNISTHALKPKHEVLTAEEKARLLKKYNVQDSQAVGLFKAGFASWLTLQLKMRMTRREGT